MLPATENCTLRAVENCTLLAPDEAVARAPWAAVRMDQVRCVFIPSRRLGSLRQPFVDDRFVRRRPSPRPVPPRARRRTRIDFPALIQSASTSSGLGIGIFKSALCAAIRSLPDTAFATRLPRSFGVLGQEVTAPPPRRACPDFGAACRAGTCTGRGRDPTRHIGAWQ